MLITNELLYYLSLLCDIGSIGIVVDHNVILIAVGIIVSFDFEGLNCLERFVVLRSVLKGSLADHLLSFFLMLSYWREYIKQ